MGRKLLLGLLLLAPLSLYPLLRDTGEYDDNPTDHPNQPPPLNQDQRLSLACLSIFPGQSFPAAIPWDAMRAIGQSQSEVLENMAKYKPIDFLELCMNRYESEIRGYRCLFDKQERVNGKLLPKERIRVHFREKPFSVHMEWIVPRNNRAFRTLYVEGENNGLLRVRTFVSFGPVFDKKVDDPEVKATSRFPITQFGMYIGAKDTLNHMRAADQKGTLHVRYEGIAKVKEAGNRLCYKLVRTPYHPPEEDGCNELTIYIDRETLLQVGSVVKDSDGTLIADYFFHDIELNPTFSEKQFAKKAL